MNGIETLLSMRQRDIPSQVVLISASPTAQYVEVAMEHHAAGFVMKPVSPKIIRGAIAKCLRNASIPGKPSAG